MAKLLFYLIDVDLNFPSSTERLAAHKIAAAWEGTEHDFRGMLRQQAHERTIRRR